MVRSRVARGRRDVLPAALHLQPVQRQCQDPAGRSRTAILAHRERPAGRPVRTRPVHAYRLIAADMVEVDVRRHLTV